MQESFFWSSKEIIHSTGTCNQIIILHCENVAYLVNESIISDQHFFL